MNALDFMAINCDIEATRDNTKYNNIIMNDFVTDLQTILMTAFIGVVIAYARYVHNLKERVAVLEKTIEDLSQALDRASEDIEKTFESIHKRLDSHSKKYDVILDRIGSMEKEVLKETGSVKAEISSLASDLKGLSNLILVSDPGIKINRQ